MIKFITDVSSFFSMIIIKQIVQFYNYLLKKVDEIKQLEKKDIKLAKLVLLIHNKNKGVTTKLLPLYSIKQVHAIDRENAILATNKRIETLKKVKSKVKDNKISKDFMAKYLESVSWIKVVKYYDSYVAFEGNGRIVALKDVFKKSDNIKVEVEVFDVNDNKMIQKKIRKVRLLNKLEIK